MKFSTKTGTYTFKEWTDGENTYKAGEVITLAESITLTALWNFETPGSGTLSFDSVNYVLAGPYLEASATYDNSIKSIKEGVTGVININARNPYSADQGGYINRPYAYVSIDLTNESAVESALLNITPISQGNGTVFVYQVDEIPEVGEEMVEGTLACKVSVSKTTSGTAQSVDITDIYNASLGKKLCFRIYGWYGNDKRYTTHVQLDAGSLSITYNR